MIENKPQEDANRPTLKPVFAAVSIKNSSKRLVELRGIIRTTSLYRKEGNVIDIGAYEGLLATIKDNSRDKKAFRIIVYLLTLQWVREAPPPGPHHNNIIDGITRLPFYHSDLVFKGFAVRSMCIILRLVNKREDAANLLTSILAMMSQDGYPQVKKSFFGGAGPKKAFDVSIKLWQDVFSAMRSIMHMPEMDQMQLLWVAAISPDSLVLARHATHLMIHMAAHSNNESFCNLLLYRIKSKNGDLSKIFLMHDLLCRCYVLKILSTFASNESAASISSLKELYTCVIKYIENINGMSEVKCVCDCLESLVMTKRSSALQHTFSTASVDNVFNIVTTALGLHLDQLDINMHKSSLAMIYRACMRLGKYYLRKSTDMDTLSATALDSSNVSEYYKVTEMCEVLTIKAKDLIKTSQPDALTSALVALLWLSPTATIDDVSWDNLEHLWLSAMTQVGEDLCMHFLDNLFQRLKQGHYNAKVHSTLSNIAHSVLSVYPSFRSCQVIHNLWAWSSSIFLRTFSLRSSSGTVKRNCYAILMESLLLVTGRRLNVVVHKSGRGGTRRHARP